MHEWHHRDIPLTARSRSRCRWAIVCRASPRTFLAEVVLAAHHLTPSKWRYRVPLIGAMKRQFSACKTYTDAQVVHHRAQRVVPIWSPRKRPKGHDGTQLFVGDAVSPWGLLPVIGRAPVATTAVVCLSTVATAPLDRGRFGMIAHGPMAGAMLGATRATPSNCSACTTERPTASRPCNGA
jgi:hypothetical protein